MMRKLWRLTFLFVYLLSYGQIKRVEPPFWWSGMRHSRIEILIYGDSISRYAVSVPGAEDVEIYRPSNPDYMFVSVETAGMPPGTFPVFLDDGKRRLRIDYELKKRRPGSAERKGFDAGDVVYLVMPDRFANAIPQNDNRPGMLEKANRMLPGGRHGGDLQGIIDRLDYLEDLGITALWCTPLWENNEPAYSYHGYAVTDHYRIDPRFGTNEDYRRLGEALHRRKMKLILDYVLNHTGDRHWLAQNPPSEDWFHIWNDTAGGFRRSNYRTTVQFDPHATRKDTQLALEGWFDRHMPDLNLKNPHVLNYLIQNAIWWIEYAGADGVRVDTYSYNDKEAAAQWTRAILREYPHLTLTGEIWLHDQAQIAYWQKDSPVGKIQGYNSGLPSVMDFTFHDALITMFDEDRQSWNKGMERAYENFVNDFLYADPYRLMVFAGNHDVSRINEIYDGDFDKYRMAIGMVLTVRGIPQLYYGDEIGMRGDKARGDGDIRRNFPGGWTDDPQNAFLPDGRTAGQEKYFRFTRKLLHWRKTNEAVRKGKFLHYAPVNNLYVYFRIYGEQRVMVIVNNSPAAQTVRPSEYAEGTGNHVTGKEIITEKTIDLTRPFVIPPKSIYIVEIK